MPGLCTRTAVLRISAMSLTMPPELCKAHQNNDKAVLDAYGFTKGTAARTSESACAAELMKLYQKLTEG